MDKNWKQLGNKLPPEEKIAKCLHMSDACVQICAEGIRTQNPGISEEELLVML